jgi:pimeloyl-ACP methyl ester carboxylesterase
MMPHVSVNGVNIEYWESGSGFPLIWAHEFAGSAESWKQQVHYFSRRYRVITYNARGYSPSGVPEDVAAYSQDQAVEDLYQLMKGLNIEKAHIGGLSMGGSTTLIFGLRHPEMAASLIVAGAGTGATDPARFKEQANGYADILDRDGMRGLEDYVKGTTRVQLMRKDYTGWQEVADLFFAHSAQGSALTFRGVQAERQPILTFEKEMRALTVPTLIIVGDEDDPCLEPGIFMKRCISSSGLVVIPQSGHAVNLEEPDLFNRAVSDFLTAVEAGKWAAREQGSGGGFLAS